MSEVGTQSVGRVESAAQAPVMARLGVMPGVADTAVPRGRVGTGLRARLAILGASAAFLLTSCMDMDDSGKPVHEGEGNSSEAAEGVDTEQLLASLIKAHVVQHPQDRNMAILEGEVVGDVDISRLHLAFENSAGAELPNSTVFEVKNGKIKIPLVAVSPDGLPLNAVITVPGRLDLGKLEIPFDTKVQDQAVEDILDELGEFPDVEEEEA
jgi:hypothetical protein